MIDKNLPEPEVKECATCYRKGPKMKGELLHWPSENATAPVAMPDGRKIEPFSLWIYECQWCRGVETKRKANAGVDTARVARPSAEGAGSNDWLDGDETKKGDAMKLCDKKCNDCPLMHEENSRMVTRILNELRDKFGEEVTGVVNSFCPNLTCCFDCRIDDFCHLEGCELAGDA